MQAGATGEYRERNSVLAELNRARMARTARTPEVSSTVTSGRLGGDTAARRSSLPRSASGEMLEAVVRDAAVGGTRHHAYGDDEWVRVAGRVRTLDELHAYLRERGDHADPVNRTNGYNRGLARIAKKAMSPQQIDKLLASTDNAAVRYFLSFKRLGHQQITALLQQENDADAFSLQNLAIRHLEKSIVLRPEHLCLIRKKAAQDSTAYLIAEQFEALDHDASPSRTDDESGSDSGFESES